MLFERQKQNATGTSRRAWWLVSWPDVRETVLNLFINASFLAGSLQSCVCVSTPHRNYKNQQQHTLFFICSTIILLLKKNLQHLPTKITNKLTTSYWRTLSSNRSHLNCSRPSLPCTVNTTCWLVSTVCTCTGSHTPVERAAPWFRRAAPRQASARFGSITPVRDLHDEATWFQTPTRPTAGGGCTILSGVHG